MARNALDEWLEKRFAPKQLAKFEAEKLKETASSRAELVGEIRRLEGDRDKQLAELTSYEKAIVAKPADALHGLLGGRRRFHYLDPAEMKMLNLPHKPLDI